MLKFSGSVSHCSQPEEMHETGDMDGGGVLNRNTVFSFLLVPTISVLANASCSGNAVPALAQPSRFAVEESEAQRGAGTCLRSESQIFLFFLNRDYCSPTGTLMSVILISPYNKHTG